MFSVYTNIFWPSRTPAVSLVTEDSSAGFCASFSTRKFSQSFRVKPRYATETDRIIFRSVCVYICHRNRPKQFQKYMLKYHKNRPTIFRSVCCHTPQKQSIRTPELLCGTKLPMLLLLHINLSLGYLKYHKNRPTIFRSVCCHTPQKQSIRTPELLCGTKLPMLLLLHINLSLEYHIIYKLV